MDINKHEPPNPINVTIETKLNSNMCKFLCKKMDSHAAIDITGCWIQTCDPVDGDKIKFTMTASYVEAKN